MSQPQQHPEKARSVFTDAIKLSRDTGGPVAKGDTILKVQDLTVRFWVGQEWFTAVENMSYELKAGEVLAIVGESGSGKTQSSMSLLGLLPPTGRATGSADLKGTELVGMSIQELREVRGNEISVIFQEPMTALNPVYTVGFQIVETLRTHYLMNPAAAKARAVELMRMVEIPEPEDSFNKFPHQLSGGMQSRVALARALVLAPELLLLDEPFSALDVGLKEELYRLLLDHQAERAMGVLMITHDLMEAVRDRKSVV